MPASQLELAGMPAPTLDLQPRAYDRSWQRVRGLVLARDNEVCQWCGARATTVDHVIALADGGARLDTGNLVASCTPCNSRRAAERTNRRRSLAPQSRQW